MPFTTQELFQGGEALYYGLNALSNNLIMVDRKQLKNPNGLILGTPGSGKSFSAKREMTNCVSDYGVMILSSATPKRSMHLLFRSSMVRSSRFQLLQTNYINPMDINTELLG